VTTTVVIVVFGSVVVQVLICVASGVTHVVITPVAKVVFFVLSPLTATVVSILEPSENVSVLEEDPSSLVTVTILDGSGVTNVVVQRVRLVATSSMHVLVETPGIVVIVVSLPWESVVSCTCVPPGDVVRQFVPPVPTVHTFVVLSVETVVVFVEPSSKCSTVTTSPFDAVDTHVFTRGAVPSVQSGPCVMLVTVVELVDDVLGASVVVGGACVVVVQTPAPLPLTAQ
jgi:hypothetical protein